jgi:hypothetical protein
LAIFKTFLPSVQKALPHSKVKLKSIETTSQNEILLFFKFLNNVW